MKSIKIDSNTVFSKCLFGFFLTAFFLSIFYFSLDMYKMTGDIIEEHLDHRDAIITNAVELDAPHYIRLKSYKTSGNIIDLYLDSGDGILTNAIAHDTSHHVQIQKLRQQHRITREMKEVYFYMAENYNRYGFAFTWLFAITSILTAIFGFLFIKKGWDNNNNDYLKIAFLICVFFSTLTGILPQVFNNKDNAQNNLSKYNYYSGVQMEIFDLFQDNSGYMRDGNLDKLDTCISAINKKIRENNDLYFDVSIEKVPANISIGPVQ
jgi:hypothetical protein